MGVDLNVGRQSLRLHLEGFEDEQRLSHIARSIFCNLTRGFWWEVKLEPLGHMLQYSLHLYECMSFSEESIFERHSPPLCWAQPL